MYNLFSKHPILILVFMLIVAIVCYIIGIMSLKNARPSDLTNTFSLTMLLMVIHHHHKRRIAKKLSIYGKA